MCGYRSTREPNRTFTAFFLDTAPGSTLLGLSSVLLETRFLVRVARRYNLQLMLERVLTNRSLCVCARARVCVCGCGFFPGVDGAGSLQGHLVVPESHAERELLAEIALSVCSPEAGRCSSVLMPSGAGTGDVLVPLPITMSGPRIVNGGEKGPSLPEMEVWWCLPPNDAVWPRSYYADSETMGEPGRTVWSGSWPVHYVVDGPRASRGLAVWNGSSADCDTISGRCQYLDGRCSLPNGSALNTDVFAPLEPAVPFGVDVLCMALSAASGSNVTQQACENSAKPTVSVVEFENRHTRTSDWAACGVGAICDCFPTPADEEAGWAQVSCSTMQLLEAPVHYPAATKGIDLGHNLITGVNGSYFSDARVPHLRRLILDHNLLTAVPFIENSRLETLALRANMIAEVTPGVFSGLPGLATLRLSDNPVTELKAGVFAALSQLVTLKLERSAVHAVSPFIFGAPPLIPPEFGPAHVTITTDSILDAGRRRPGMISCESNDSGALACSCGRGLVKVVESPSGSIASQHLEGCQLAPETELAPLPLPAFVELSRPGVCETCEGARENETSTAEHCLMQCVTAVGDPSKSFSFEFVCGSAEDGTPQWRMLVDSNVPNGMESSAICAREGQYCICDGWIMYGIEPSWAVQKASGGGVTPCSNSVFGDPVVGIRKECRCVPSVRHGYSFNDPEVDCMDSTGGLVRLSKQDPQGDHYYRGFAELRDDDGSSPYASPPGVMQAASHESLSAVVGQRALAGYLAVPETHTEQRMLLQMANIMASYSPKLRAELSVTALSPNACMDKEVGELYEVTSETGAGALFTCRLGVWKLKRPGGGYQLGQSATINGKTVYVSATNRLQVPVPLFETGPTASFSGGCRLGAILGEVWWAVPPNDYNWPRSYYADSPIAGQPGRTIWNGSWPTWYYADGPADQVGVAVWNGTGSCGYNGWCGAGDCALTEGYAVPTSFSEPLEHVGFADRGGGQCAAVIFDSIEATTCRVLNSGDSDRIQVGLIEFEGRANRQSDWVACGPRGICLCWSQLEPYTVDCRRRSILTTPRVNVPAVKAIYFNWNLLIESDGELFGSRLYQLRRLELRSNQLVRCPVIDNAALRELDVSNNAIVRISTGTFSGVAGLTDLKLSGNPITVLKKGVFEALQSLQTLELARSDVRAVSTAVFGSLSPRLRPGTVPAISGASSFVTCTIVGSVTGASALNCSCRLALPLQSARTDCMPTGCCSATIDVGSGQPTPASPRGTVPGSSDLAADGSVAGPVAGALALVTTIFILLMRRRRASAHKKSLLERADILQEMHELTGQRARAVFMLNYKNLLVSSVEALDDEFAALELPRDAVTLESKIGQGAYTEIFVGSMWRPPGPLSRVVVKQTLKDASAVRSCDEALLLEARLLQRVAHPAIVPVLGVVTASAPVLVVTELMDNGPLLGFLRRSRPQAAVTTVVPPLTFGDVTVMAARLASGCAFLEAHKIIHRQLAARNVLVGKTAEDVRLADLGSARSIREGDYTTKTTHSLAQWMAPESLLRGIFGRRSDVWSFGVLIWEITSLGKSPYGKEDSNAIATELEAGGRLPEELFTPPRLYSKLIRCWAADPAKRPSFAVLNDELQVLRMVTAASPSECSVVVGQSGELLTHPGGERWGPIKQQHQAPMPPETMDDYVHEALGRLVAAGVATEAQVSSARCPARLDRTMIRLDRQLGAGQFGEVWGGTLTLQYRANAPAVVTDVAVKIPTASSSAQTSDELLDEAALMAQVGEHPNVVSLLGLVYDDAGPPMMVVGLCAYGSLDRLLRLWRDPRDLDGEPDPNACERLQAAAQVARGMSHLSSASVVHRDLAARNVLVAAGQSGDIRDRIYRVADFGLSRAMRIASSDTSEDKVTDNIEKESLYYRSQAQIFPVRWTAPEAAVGAIYSIKSDVWSFGMMVVEEYQGGEHPYANMSTSTVMGLLGSSFRIPRPLGCPGAVYDLLLSCWSADPAQRPSFEVLSETLDAIRAGVPASTNAVKTKDAMALSETNIDTAVSALSHAPAPYSLPDGVVAYDGITHGLPTGVGSHSDSLSSIQHRSALDPSSNSLPILPTSSKKARGSVERCGTCRSNIKWCVCGGEAQTHRKEFFSQGGGGSSRQTRATKRYQHTTRGVTDTKETPSTLVSEAGVEINLGCELEAGTRL